MYHQLSAIVALDQNKLRQLLNESNRTNLILTQANIDNLEELVAILKPFAEVTDVIQGDTFPTLGCVVPSVVSLYKILISLCETAQFHKVFARALLDSLTSRFHGMLLQISLIAQDPQPNPKAPYADFVYVMAAVLDPKYKFIWLDADHSGTPELKQEVKKSIQCEYCSSTYFVSVLHIIFFA